MDMVVYVLGDLLVVISSSEGFICFYGNTYELGHEGNHQIEKTNGLDESETQNGVREELATESGVAGNTVEQGSEDETDTDTGTSQTNGGGTHTQVLGDLDHSLGDLRGVSSALESLASGGVDDLGGLLTLDGLEGSSIACGVIGLVNARNGQYSMPLGLSIRSLIQVSMMGGHVALLSTAAKIFLRTGDGALGNSAGDRRSHGRSSDLGAHGGGDSRSDNASRGHCDG